MNNDLISRSALLEKVHWVAGEGTSGRVYVSDINEAPAVDAEPVRHGIWTSIADGDMAECSECGECYDTETEGGECYDTETEGVIEFSKFYRFCPNCGAKMDGERKDGDGK